MMQQVRRFPATHVPPEKREALGKQVETEIKKYVEESYRWSREGRQAGPYDHRTDPRRKVHRGRTEELIASFDSPVNSKYAAARTGNAERLRAEARPRRASSRRPEAAGTRRQGAHPWSAASPRLRVAGLRTTLRASYGTAKNTTKSSGDSHGRNAQQVNVGELSRCEPIDAVDRELLELLNRRAGLASRSAT